MAVRIHQPGQNPAAVENGVDAANRLAADAPVDNPQFDGFFVRKPDPSNVVRH